MVANAGIRGPKQLPAGGNVRPFSALQQGACWCVRFAQLHTTFLSFSLRSFAFVSGTNFHLGSSTGCGTLQVPEGLLVLLTCAKNRLFLASFTTGALPIQSGRCFCFRWLRVISVCDSIIQFARLYCRLIVYFSNQHSFIEFAGKAEHQFEGSWPAATVLVASSTRLDCSSRCKDGRTL